MVAKRLAIVVVALLAIGVQQLSGAEVAAKSIAPRTHKIEVRDVALQGAGVLTGQIVDTQGAAIANTSLSISKIGKPIVTTRTDQQGRFRVEGLTGGVHQLSAAGQVGVYRLWAPNTAPPAAQQGIMLVANTEVIRGQCVGCGTPVCGTPSCGSGCGGGAYGRGASGGGVVGWMANHPVLTAGGIAAAIAVPLAVDDDDPPASP